MKSYRGYPGRRRGPIPGLDKARNQAMGEDGAASSSVLGRWREGALRGTMMAGCLVAGLAGGIAFTPAPGNAFFGGGGFSGIVFDPTNHGVNLEKLARDVQMVAQQVQVVMNTYQMMQTMGPVGALLGIAKMPGLKDAFPIELDAETLEWIETGITIAETAATVYNAGNSVYNRARNMKGGGIGSFDESDLRQLGELAAVLAARGTGQSELMGSVARLARVGMRFVPEGERDYGFYFLDASLARVQSVLGVANMTDRKKATEITWNRRREFSRSSEESVAVALNNLQIGAEAGRRTQALFTAAANAGNEREQTAVLTQAVIALIESTEATRSINAQMLRQMSLRDLNGMDPLIRQSTTLPSPSATPESVINGADAGLQGDVLTPPFVPQ